MAAIYQTKSGDAWDSIAKEVYGSELHVSFLMANNQQFLDYFVFPAGIKLVIMDKPQYENRLPDWRV